jgi:LysM repeat protein
MFAILRKKGRHSLAAACVLTATACTAAAWKFDLLPIDAWLVSLNRAVHGTGSQTDSPATDLTTELGGIPPQQEGEFPREMAAAAIQSPSADDPPLQAEPAVEAESVFAPIPARNPRQPRRRPAAVTNPAEGVTERNLELVGSNLPAQSAPQPRPGMQGAALDVVPRTEGGPRYDPHVQPTAGQKESPPAGRKPKSSPKVQPVTTSGEVFDQQEIEKLVAAGNEAAALKLLSQWYWKQPGQRGEIQQQLDRLAKAAYFSPQPNDCEPYVIQPGDQLRKVANKYQLTWQYLAKLNQVDPKKIRTGKKLKVVEGPFSAVVDLSDYELTIHCHGNFVRKYRVGTGKDGVSPIGEFVVKEKLENPTYYGPNGDVKAPDDPLNPLGERWIDIGDSFGIHGTIEPDSIGRSESRGCIRMLNSDVEDVYDLLTIGSPVRIQR